MDDPRALLVGPRGRRLCLELAGTAARRPATPEGAAYTRAAFIATYHLDPGAGTSRVMFGADLTGPGPAPTPQEVARLLDAVPLDGIDDRTVLDALAGAVDSARYWQEPDGEDVLAATPAMREALTRVAAAIITSGAATWWSTPVDRAAQWTVAFEGADTPLTPSPAATRSATARERLSRWRTATAQDEVQAEQERPADPRALWSGAWWSTPPRDLARTTRGLGPLGPVGLWLVEDSWGWEAAESRSLALPAGATVYEVTGPEAWVHLCRRLPLEVTASRRHDWYRTTGVAGRWLIPDWSLAAAEYDAVHLTVAGYLTTAGRALGVTPDTATVLAGWDPDTTSWLTDAGAEAGSPISWRRRRDPGGTWLAGTP